MAERYAKEALEVAQRSFDQMQEIDRLGKEVARWERQARLAEGEVDRLQQRETDLLAQIEMRTQELAKERDDYRFRLNNMVAQFEMAGTIILKCLEAARTTTTSKVDINRLTNEIEKELVTPKSDPEPFGSAKQDD